VFIYDIFQAAYRFSEEKNKQSYNDAGVNFVTCLLTGRTDCGDHPYDRPDGGLLLTQQILADTIGLVIFFCFGLMPGHAHKWREWLKSKGEKTHSQTDVPTLSRGRTAEISSKELISNTTTPTARGVSSIPLVPSTNTI